MKIIEGFHINKFQRGTKKGQDRINHSVRYCWKIPDKLDGKIDKGDVVRVNCKKADSDVFFKGKVLVVDIREQRDGEKVERSVIEIIKKFSE